jgi:ribosomal-protein-alanine N-acetyltransferase
MLNFSLRRNIDIVRIRRAIPSDVPQISSLEQQSVSAAHWTAQQYEALFSPDAPVRAIFVAADDSNDASLDGFLIARCLRDEWEIENVVVAGALRRQGIGRSLIQELTAPAGSAGVRSIILEVRESNQAAVRLYESIGFREEGRRKDYYRNPAEDALLYRLTLHMCDKIP